MIALVAILQINKRISKLARDREASRIRNHQHAIDKMENMPAKQFKRMFKMSR